MLVLTTSVPTTTLLLPIWLWMLRSLLRLLPTLLLVRPSKTT